MLILISFIIFFVVSFIVIWFFFMRKGTEDSSGWVNSQIKTGWLPGAISSALGEIGSRTRIVFNGQEYSSPEEMPADVRRAYDQLLVDSDRNGIPDVFEGKGVSQVFRTELASNTSQGPTERLKKLKEARDSGLITEQDYETKKAEILNEM